MTDYKKAKALFQAICHKLGYQIVDVKQKTRLPNIVLIRQLFWYYCKPSEDAVSEENLKVSLDQLGNIAGGYNHATVIYGIKQFKRHYEAGDRLCIQYYNATVKLVRSVLANKIKIYIEEDSNTFTVVGVKCIYCNGSGTYGNNIPCDNCNGHGIINRKLIAVTINE